MSEGDDGPVGHGPTVTAPVVLLGPQRTAPTLQGAVRSRGIRGRVAAITAGWEEREDDDHELHDHLGGVAFNLKLYARAEAVFKEDPEVYEILSEAYEGQRQLQSLYDVRLAHAAGAVRELMEFPGDSKMREREIELAFEASRSLDTEHLERVRVHQNKVWERVAPRQRPSIRRHREELREELETAEALCIAGGHVAVLLNRLRLFELLELWGDKPLFAWSAGAMVLAERVVLFHDSPPQGAGNAEVFQPGLGRCEGVVLLPHAERRLRLDNAERVQRFARRMLPLRCLAMDDGARVDLEDGAWTNCAGVRHLRPDGTVVDFEPNAVTRKVDAP